MNNEETYDEANKRMSQIILDVSKLITERTRSNAERINVIATLQFGMWSSIHEVSDWKSKI